VYAMPGPIARFPCPIYTPVAFGVTG
jgi:hypothetical protein